MSGLEEQLASLMPRSLTYTMNIIDDKISHVGSSGGGTVDKVVLGVDKVDNLRVFSLFGTTYILIGLSVV